MVRYGNLICNDMYLLEGLLLGKPIAIHALLYSSPRANCMSSRHRGSQDRTQPEHPRTEAAEATDLVAMEALTRL